MMRKIKLKSRNNLLPHGSLLLYFVPWLKNSAEVNSELWQTKAISSYWKIESGTDSYVFLD